MELPSEVAVMTLPHTTLFPHALLPLYIFEPRYRLMVRDCLEGGRMFCVAMRQPVKHSSRPVGIAGLGLIRACVRNPDGTSNLILQGLARVELGPRVRLRPYRVHTISPLEPTVKEGVRVDALCAKVLELVSERLNQGFQLPIELLKKGLDPQNPEAVENLESTLSSYAMKQGIQFLSQINDPSQLADLVSCTLLPDSAERQAILEAVDLEHRLRSLINFLMIEIRRNRRKSGG